MKMVWPIFKMFIFPPIRLFIKGIYGMKNIPKDKNFIVTSNHPSWWDPFIIGTIITPFLSKKVHFMASPRFWFLGDTICRKWAGCIPVYKDDKGESAIKEALSFLKNNKIVGIFPEGIAKPSKKIKGKLGIARLAIESKKPVIPLGLNGVDQLVSGGSIIPKKFRRITVNIGEPLYFSRYYNKPYNIKILRRVTEEIVSSIETLLECQKRPRTKVRSVF